MLSEKNIAGRMGGIKQQTLSQRKGVRGRAANGGIIASGTPVRNPGRIAGGAKHIPNPQLVNVHAPIVFRSPAAGGSRPGGLIDRRQQIDPRSTDFVHPFSGGRYLSVPSHSLLPAISTGWNGFLTHQADTPNNQPHERGTFFRKSVTPQIKTQFGAHSRANASPPADTAFQRHPLLRIPRPQVQSVTPTEKVVNQPGNVFPASFLSFNKLRSDPVPQAAGSSYGMGGRWGELKRSANSVAVQHE